jgi:thiamine kinase-like enzyme
MYRHKYFNLYLHDNDELEQILQAEIVKRGVLHEWPLSCVELVITNEGSKWVYKSQFGPTVESKFYANARSRLLVSGKTVYTSEAGYVNMLTEFIESPRIEDLNLSDEAIIRAGNDIIKSIAEIEGQLPYYLDISENRLWQALMETMLEKLERLVSQGIFCSVDNLSLRELRKRAFSEEVTNALDENIGYVHNDLSGDNVFVVPDGYRIIDWQRPILGPKELDLARLLESRSREALSYVTQGIVQIMYLLRISWFTECAVRWFPAGQDSYDRSISQLINLVG